jgi:hypothetical protein
VLLFWLARKVGGVSYRQANPMFFAAAVAVMLVPVAGMVWFPSLNIEMILIAAVCAAVYSAIAWKKALDCREIAWAKEKASAMISFVRAS